VTMQEPARAVTAASGIVQIATGWIHACARLATGGVVCWGDGGDGELGDGMSKSSLTGVPVANLPTPITDLSASGSTSCAVANGGVWCWGRNFSGQIGDGTLTPRPAPVLVGVPGTAARVFNAFTNTCALNTLGELYCWGSNSNGELGLGDTM